MRAKHVRIKENSVFLCVLRVRKKNLVRHPTYSPLIRGDAGRARRLKKNLCVLCDSAVKIFPGFPFSRE